MGKPVGYVLFVEIHSVLTFHLFHSQKLTWGRGFKTVPIFHKFAFYQIREILVRLLFCICWVSSAFNLKKPYAKEAYFDTCKWHISIAYTLHHCTGHLYAEKLQEGPDGMNYRKGPMDSTWGEFGPRGNKREVGLGQMDSPPPFLPF